MRIVSQSISALFYGLLPTVALAQPVVTPPPFTAQNPTLGTLPPYNDASANWKNAGLAKIGGIPTRNTQCGATVNPTGLNPPVANDDFVKITAAIAACPAGQVVQLGSGTFQIAMSELPILLNKGITLRGTGICNNGSDPRCSTVIHVYDGALETYNTTAQCGVTTGSASACPGTGSVIFVAPVGLFNFYWSGCQAGGFIDPAVSGCGTLLAADVAQGATQIQVADNANFVVGQWFLIDEDPQVVSTANPVGNGQANIPASSDFLTASGSPVTMRLGNPDVSSPCTTTTVGGVYSFCTNRVNSELHLVTAKGVGCPGVTCTVTFDDPLTMAFRQSGSHGARAYWSSNSSSTSPLPFLTQAGVENLSITNTGTRGGVWFEFCAYCWVKNVEVGNWVGPAINTTYTARTQITGSYVHNCLDCQPNGNEYSIGITTASTEILVDNNILLFSGKGTVGRVAAGFVVSYNYIDKLFYEINVVSGDYFQDMGANGTHYAGTHHGLFEGNWSPNCDGDETHGNAIYHTFFRNHCTGIRTAFVDPSSVVLFSGANNLTVDDANNIGWNGYPTPSHSDPRPLRPAGPMALNYWYAFVANVLGLSTVTTGGNGWVYNGTTSLEGTNTATKSIWLSGWVGQEWNYFTDPNIDGRSNTWIHRHGNYDYVTPGINDWNAGYSRALPNSYYLASQPPYFGASGVNCTYPWPGVTPTAGSVLQTPTGAGCTATDWLPAKARFAAGTPFMLP